jgi:hypothetical protein
MFCTLRINCSFCGSGRPAKLKSANSLFCGKKRNIRKKNLPQNLSGLQYTQAIKLNYRTVKIYLPHAQPQGQSNLRRVRFFAKHMVDHQTTRSTEIKNI